MLKVYTISNCLFGKMDLRSSSMVNYGAFEYAVNEISFVREDAIAGPYYDDAVEINEDRQ